MKKFIKDYLKLLKFALPFKGGLILASVCMGISTIFNGISLGMIIPIADRVFTNKKIIVPVNVKLPAYLSGIIENLNNLDPLIILKTSVIFIGVIFVVKGIFEFLQSYLMNVVAQGIVREVRNDIYKKFQELSLDFYSKKRAGELISRITNDVGYITNAISYGLTDLIYQVMQVIFFAFMVFFIYWKLALISFILFPLIMFPVVKIGKRIKKFSVETQNKMADLNTILTETIQGAYIVKVFCREDYEIARFKDINMKYYKYMIKSAKRTILLSPLTECIGVFGAIMILALVGKEVIMGKLSFGVFGLFLASLMSMIRPFKKLSNVHSINQQAISASNRIYEILEEKTKVVERVGAKELSCFNDKIEFKDVWFRYEKDDVLKDINLQVKKGDVVALVGHSGAGKSTLVSLVARLYEPQQGSITIDGVDIRELKIRSLRSFISVVSQDMVLFNSTVRDNIAYGREGASDEDIFTAAKKAYAFDFINKMPKGFATVIGDRGARLSGGEKQRIAIARAFLKDSPILILDEATSALDSQSERLVKEAFYNLMKERTTFVIAHRLSTVQQANIIVVMAKGAIVEMGTHTELINRESLYKTLYDLQFNV